MSLESFFLKVGEMLISVGIDSAADYIIDKIKDAKKMDDLNSLLLAQLQEEEKVFLTDMGVLNFDFSPLYEVIPSSLLNENSLRNILSVNKKTRALESTKVLNKCVAATSPSNQESKDYISNIVLHCYQAMDAFFVSLVPEEYKALAKEMVEEINKNTNDTVRSVILSLNKQIDDANQKLDVVIEEIRKLNSHDNTPNQELPIAQDDLSRIDALEFGCEQKEIIALSTLDSNAFYIKELAFKFLYGCDKEISDALIFQTSKVILHKIENKDNRWKLLNDFFELFTSYKQFDSKNDERRILFSSNIFDLISRDVKNGISKIRLSVKGRPSQGKSTFLSLMYLYLLGLYFKRDFLFLPVYFNRERLIEYSYDEKVRIFERFVERANKLAKLLKTPICFILDGFNEYNYYSHSFDDHVYTEYVEFENGKICKDSIFILSVDTDNSNTRQLKETYFGKNRQASNVLYLRDIELNSLRSKTADKFINTLSELIGLNDATTIAENIRKSGLEYVDMNLLVRHGKAFANGMDLVSIFDSYGRQDGVFDTTDTKTISRCAYHVLVKKTKYRSLSDLNINVSHSTYSTLCRQREVAMYYCAKYYFSEIKRLSDENENVGEDSVTDEFYSHEQNVYLKELRDKNEIDFQDLIGFMDLRFGQLSYLGRSQIIYLFGNWKDTLGNRIIRRSKVSFETKDVSTVSDKEGAKFRAEIMNRSKIVIEAHDDPDRMEEYITELLKNPIARRVNRIAHLLYYSDLRYEDAIRVYNKNIIYKGFDIYHTFLILTDRIIDPHYNTNMKLLDMITLCDLMEHRFRQPIAVSKKDPDETVSSLFYTNVYNDSIDLSPIQIVNKYFSIIDDFQTEDIRSSFIRIYIEKCREDAAAVRAYYENSNTKDYLSRKMFHQSNVLKTVSNIDSVCRKGWQINKVIDNGADAQFYSEFSDRESLETVGQHIYQTYLIGLLYLPVDYSPSDSEAKRFPGDYSKQAILNTILIHDIGECKLGDWPSYFKCYEEIKTKENAFNEQLLIGGAYSETADLSDYMDLWNNWVKTNPDQGGELNAEISKEIDAIQFLYQYFTLKQDGKLSDFTPERHKQISEAKKKIKTAIGKKILKFLVTDNPHFVSNKERKPSNNET